MICNSVRNLSIDVLLNYEINIFTDLGLNFRIDQDKCIRVDKYLR